MPSAVLPPAGTPFPVTPDQEAVLQLVLAGLPDKAIARRLGLSHGGVRSRLQALYRDSGERGRVRVAVRWALYRAGAR